MQRLWECAECHTTFQQVGSDATLDVQARFVCFSCYNHRVHEFFVREPEDAPFGQTFDMRDERYR